MLDITGSECVQVEIRNDGKVVWINNEEGCIVRICRIKKIEVIDNREDHD
jgi:hypothetical protein